MAGGRAGRATAPVVLLPAAPRADRVAIRTAETSPVRPAGALPPSAVVAVRPPVSVLAPPAMAAPVVDGGVEETELVVVTDPLDEDRDTGVPVMDAAELGFPFAYS